MYPKDLAWFAQIVTFSLFHWFRSIDCTPIVGGNFVPKEEISRYRFVVSLQDRNQLQNGTRTFKHFCGGSLISASWILTAGHCVYYKKKENIVAAIGYQDLDSDDVVYREIDAIKLMNFVPSGLKNDIAMIRLKVPIFPDDSSWSLGLIPDQETQLKSAGPCKIVGYGADKYGGRIQKKLKEGEVYPITQEKCTSILGKIMAPQEGDNSLCALGNLQDTCQGDSGGPLLCPVDGKDYIFGIVSHGLTCGQPGVPSIYTETVPYKQWIDNIVINEI